MPDPERLLVRRLIRITDALWQLRGLERLPDGREVLQEWICDLLS